MCVVDCIVQNILEVGCTDKVIQVDRRVRLVLRPLDHGWVKINIDGATSMKED